MKMMTSLYEWTIIERDAAQYTVQPKFKLLSFSVSTAG